MPVPRILLLEDSPIDAELIEATLLEGGLAFTLERVETRSHFLQALESRPDLILSDYNLPTFDGKTALALTLDRAPTVPFIFVSGVMGEEVAIDMLKQGAIDYVLKQRLERLVPAVDRAMREVREQTQRRKAEAALQQSEERFRIVQDLSIDGFTILKSVRDEQGTISDFEWEYVNPKAAEILGQPAAELIGQRFLQRLPKADPEFFNRYVQIVETGVPQEFEILYDSDNISGWFRHMAVKLNDGVAVSFSNITKRKLAEQKRLGLLQREQAAREQAETANRMKDEFLAVLSHELRTPLNPILGWTRLLQTHKLSQAKTIEALSTIERNARLQAKLIEDLLDVSRILQGKLALSVAPVNLVTPITAALETIRLSAQEKAIDVSFTIDDDSIESTDGTRGKLPETAISSGRFRVMGDLNRLQQVISNLLANAVKFTPSGGRIEVILSGIHSDMSDRAQPDVNYAKIQVRDTGKGIHPDFLPYVFERFRQEDGSITRKFGGLGLGLAIVRQLVELHGGTVTAESPGEGQGATFTARLPLLRRLSSLRPELAQERAELPESSLLAGMQILVVDDEEDSRNYVSFVLEQEHAHVFRAASAVEALRTLNQSQIDLIISDIGMPDINGYMLIQEVRRRSASSDDANSADSSTVPMGIALTAYAGADAQQQALSAGFQLHLPKPVDPIELVKAASALALKREALYHNQ
jgi:signal transduction histidine kinase